MCYINQQCHNFITVYSKTKKCKIQVAEMKFLRSAKLYTRLDKT